MAVNDPNKGKPISHVIRDWAEDHPGTVTGMVTGFVFGAVCTVATAGAGLLACAAMGGAISSAIGSSIDYVDQTPASERNWGDFLWQVGKDAAIGAALGVAGEGFGVVLQGAAKPLLTNASRALTNAFTDAAASGVDDVAKVTWRSTWDDVVDGVSTTWNAKVPFKPRVANDAPTTTATGQGSQFANAVDPPTKPGSPTHGELSGNTTPGTQSHHIIQDAAARDLPGYARGDAPAIELGGSGFDPTTPRGRATTAQRTTELGGTYADELAIAKCALEAAGCSPTAIGYTPDIPNAAWEAAAREGVPIARTPQELIAIVKELGR